MALEEPSFPQNLFERLSLEAEPEEHGAIGMGSTAELGPNDLEDQQKKDEVVERALYEVPLPLLQIPYQ